jgi:hypothetical protein
MLISVIEILEKNASKVVEFCENGIIDIIKNAPDVNEDLLHLLWEEGGWEYQVHFVDNPENVWTVPVYFSEARISYILNDCSIDRVRLLKNRAT